MKKIFITIIVILLLCGCNTKQIDIRVEIPKEVEIAKAAARIKENMEGRDAKVQSLEIAALLPLAKKAIEESFKWNAKRDKVIYRAVIYDNDTKNGKYELDFPDCRVKIEIEKKENKNEKSN